MHLLKSSVDPYTVRVSSSTKGVHREPLVRKNIQNSQAKYLDLDFFPLRNTNSETERDFGNTAQTEYAGSRK